MEGPVVGEDANPLSSAIVHNDVITRIRLAVAVHILLPIAAETPGTDDLKLQQFGQGLDVCPLYIGSTALGRTCAWLSEARALKAFLKRLCDET